MTPPANSTRMARRAAPALSPWPPAGRKSRAPRLVRFWRSLLIWLSTPAVRFAFIPGVVAAIAIRTVLAQLLGHTVRHERFATHVGGETQLSGDLAGWPATAFGLLPPLLLATLGALLLLPTLVNLELLGISPLPVGTSDPTVFAGTQLGATVVPSAVATLSAGALLACWAAIACFYCAAPDYAVLSLVRTQLKDVDRARTAARVLRAALIPITVLARLLSLLDQVALWFGLNVLIASGGMTIFGILILEAWIVRHVYV
jgi:hypothetical protein